MERSTDRILTTHGGRLPNPESAAAAREARDRGDAEQAGALVREGIAETLSRQLQVGIDIVSDGEFHKRGPRDPRYYAERYTGIVVRDLGPGESSWVGESSPEMLDPRFGGFFAYATRVGAFPDSGYPPIPGMLPGTGHSRLVVADAIAHRGPDAINSELALTRAALEQAGIPVERAFYPQLSPNWVAHFLFNEHYADDEECFVALAEAMAHEYRAVIDAGFILQIDDPALADKYYMFNPPLSVADYRRHQEPRIEALNHAIAGLPADRIRYHTCWGSWHFPHTRDIALEHIVDLILRVEAQAYSIESGSIRHLLDVELWERGDVTLPEGKILIPGVISHSTSNLVEPPELVAHRLRRWGAVVGAENVIAGTDCGLGGRCHDDVAWAKLEVLAEGAARARSGGRP